MMRLRVQTDDDAGLTLVELIMYMVILVIVMLMAGAIFINIIQNERYARGTADAGNEAQLVFKQVEYDLRSAKWARVAHGGQALVLATREASSASDATAKCVTYFYDDVDRELRRDSSTSATTAQGALAAANTSAMRTLSGDWNVVGTDVEPVGAAPVFGPTDATISSPETVTVDLRLDTFTDRKPIEFSKAISLRPQSDLTIICN